ncbi:ArsB/NhaD family transporter [Helicovermis profundi]|uniref:ArsB/NhaD family transporter n=2 Tax=Helicovermis profundi TaxID=3065157 RepID=A0AAU9EHD7_9FIRM|nr:ArsB/NhaD family transporter [Clostridia bacterium S502]
MVLNYMMVAVAIFLITYIAIVLDKINSTTVALFGAGVMLVIGVINQKQAIANIDFNTIGLLVGMMIIVNILKRTGVFEFLAIKAAKLAKGDPWKIVVLFSLLTALASALLDNVTTVLLIVPVTLVITDTLEVNPIPFLVPEILIANIGGTATLIGDPPNIMIGSAANLGFMDFIINLAPVIVVITAVTLFIFKFIYRNGYHASDDRKKIVLSMNEEIAIKNHKLLKKSLFVLILTMLGFIIHDKIGLESATVALSGAALLLLLSGIDPEDILIEVEWSTIFFFMALFILVGALVEVGAIDILAKGMLSVTKGNPFVTAMVILWVSAIASSFLNNIPFVATMIPLIQSMEAVGHMNVTPLWWALALGACLGGNGTLIGASANVIVGGMLDKHGNKLTFGSYFKVGFPLMLVSIVISSAYLWIFYL